MNITQCITHCFTDNDDLITFMPYGVGFIVGGGLTSFILLSWFFFTCLLTIKGFRDAVCCCLKCRKKLSI